MIFKYTKHLVLLFIFNNVIADESKQLQIMKTKVICDSIEITAATACMPVNLSGYPACQNQEFIFHKKNNKPINVKAEGLLIKLDDLEVETLDYLASDWGCISGINGKYLLVSYYNGGNCPECEFYMIYDLKGNKLMKNRNSFDFVAKKLRLTEGWSKNTKKIPISEE